MKMHKNVLRKTAYLCLAYALFLTLLIPFSAKAQNSESQASIQPPIPRETPINVPELIEKVKKGIIVIHVIPTENPLRVQETGFALGSGFIIDKDGHALTNTHVAAQSAVMQAVLWDGSSYQATLVAAAPGYDSALIKLQGVPPEKLFPVTLGDSDTVKPGDLALAMGSPGAPEGFNVERSDPFEYWGLRATATMRVVSGRDTSMVFQVAVWNAYRSEFGLQYATNLPYVFAMQVPINGGNSGGPLFNRYGEVIGINTWGGESVLSQQSNVAVPINYVKNFVLDVLEGRRHDIPWLGLHVAFPGNITRVDAYIEFRERFRKPGLHVYGVEKDSPAERAGLRPGDEILTVNGNYYPVPEDFRAEVLEGKIGQEYRMVVRRGNKTFSTIVYSVSKPPWIYNFSV